MYNSTTESSTDYSAFQGWDLGEYVKINPSDYSICTSYSDLSECGSRFANVADMTPMIEAINEGKSPEENISIQGDQYDAHYLVGNYYSWGAVTAGTGVGIDTGDAAGSICPAGWELPISGDTLENPEYNGFYNLLGQYGLTNTASSGSYSVIAAPLYFVGSGYVAPDKNSLDYAGGYGCYWGRRGVISTVAFSLYFYGQEIVPSNYGYRNNGDSVRCVAAG